MQWPWVSRALYERVLKELEESEKERKSLLDRIIGSPPLLEALAEVLPDPSSKEAQEMVDPDTGILNAGHLRAAFRKAKKQGRA